MRTTLRTLRALRILAPAAGFYLLTVGLLAGILGLDLAITGPGHRLGAVAPAEVWGISAVIACLLLYGLFAVRGAGHPRPDGLRVSHEEQPALWQLVERTAAAVGVRPPGALWLTADPELAVDQRSWLLGLVPGPRRLCLGAPLLVGLTSAQLGALLAHELGHDSPQQGREDTPLPALLRRNRTALQQVLRRYADTPAPAPAPATTAPAESGSALTLNLGSLPTSFSGSGPKKWFGGIYTTYARSCLRATQADARRQELAADRLTARTAGRDTAVAALRRARALDTGYRRYQQDYLRMGWDQGACPQAALVVPAFRELLRSPEGQQALTRLEADPPRERIPPHDAHPPTAERITALRQLPASATAPEDAPDDRFTASAEALLTDPDRTWTLVVEAQPGVRERRGLPWDDLAAVAGRAELDAASAGLRTSLTTVLRRRTPDLVTALDAIDDGRWAELADWIPRVGAARTVPVPVGRSLNLTAAAEGLYALVLTTLVQQGRGRWTIDWQHGRRLTLDPDLTAPATPDGPPTPLDSLLGPALDTATATPPDTTPLRLLLRLPPVAHADHLAEPR